MSAPMDVWEPIRRGDLLAYEAMFRTWYKPLCGYANKFFGDMDEAENVVQDLFTDLWERRAQVQIQDQLRPYLYRAVFNRCLNQQRKMARMVSIDKTEVHEVAAATASGQAEVAQLEQLYLAAVQAMPAARRQIFSLSRLEGKSYKEIAEGLQISVKTVEAQMGKALGFLRLQLADYLVSVALLLAKTVAFLSSLTPNT